MAASRSLFYPVAPETLFGVIVDYEHYPEFLPMVRAARVLSRGVNRAEVELEVSLLGKRIAYTLDFEERPPFEVRWRLLRSSFLTENNGSWLLRPEAGGVHGTYTIEVEAKLIPKTVGTGLIATELSKILEGFRKR